MPSVTFTSYLGNTNTDQKVGAAITEYFSGSGTIPSNATITSATVYVSSFKVYTSKGLYLTIGSFGATSTFSYNESVHSEQGSMTASSNFRGFSGGSLVISINTSQSTSGNMVNFRDGCYITITVNYSESTSTSTASLSPTTVQVGSSIYLYISAASGTFHTATWAQGSYASNQSIASGQSSVYFTIPESWASAITSTSASGRVTLSTYISSGTFVGSNTYYFTVTLPASASAPTIGNFSLTHIPGDVPTGWGVFVQGKSKVQMALQNVSASSGSTISTYKFAGGGYSWNSSSDLTYTTGFLSTSGTNTFTATVTDSRGYSTTKSLSVNVEPYDPPAIVSLTTYRCDAASPFAANETGPSILARIVTSFSSVSGLNALNIRIAFRRVGNTDWSANYIIEYDGGWVLPAQIASTDESPYEVRITLFDSLSTTTQTFEVAGAAYTMFFAKGGRNVSIGMAGTKDQALEINPAWKIYHGSTDVTSKISGITPIGGGGTGASTASGAQTNLGAAAASHVHAATSITSGVLPVARGGTGVSALTASRALVTDTSGNVAVSAVTSTQLGYLSGATSNIQTQLNALKTSSSAPRIVYGSATINGNTAAIIYYSGFSYIPYISVTYSQTGANWSGDNGCIKVYNKTTTYAYVIVGGSFATSRTVDWIAIGT